jgi:hypothetical protein
MNSQILESLNKRCSIRGKLPVHIGDLLFAADIIEATARSLETTPRSSMSFDNQTKKHWTA